MAPPYASPQALEVKIAFSYGCKRGLFLTGLCSLGQASKESSEASVYTCSPAAPSAQSDPAVAFSTFAVKGPNSISSCIAQTHAILGAFFVEKWPLSTLTFHKKLTAFIDTATLRMNNAGYNRRLD